MHEIYMHKEDDTFDFMYREVFLQQKAIAIGDNVHVKDWYTLEREYSSRVVLLSRVTY